MPVVYADILVAFNWLVDYLLLSSTAMLLRITVKRPRLVLGGLLGGFCACIIFLPPLSPLLSVAVRMGLALLLIRVTFPWNGYSGFLKRTVVFFILSALFSGLTLLLRSWSGGDWIAANNGMLYCDISPLMLTVFTLISYGGVRLYELLTRRRMATGSEYRLTIDDGVGQYRGRALYDTGLHLREPFSGKAVILVKKGALNPFLNQRLRQALSDPTDRNNDVSSTARIRLIPCRTVAGDSLFPAFVPGSVHICAPGEQEREISGVYVALVPDLGRGEYEALLGSDVTE